MQPNSQSCPVKNGKSQLGRSASQYTAATTFSQQNIEMERRMNEVQRLPEVNRSNIQCLHYFNSQQIDILKNSICKGVSDEEFQIFLMACQKTQLDPFMKQIYAVKRKVKKPDGSWGESMTIQTGIDGYRLIAERTERYVPGPEPTYVYDKDGQLISATAYIKKQTKDGTWHTVSASAYLDEYMQTFFDKQTGEKKPTGMWINMQRTMLAKCAEAQALRKAFPAQMSGVYTKEEMQQADVEEIKSRLTIQQVEELDIILGDCTEKYRTSVYQHLKSEYGVSSLSEVPVHIYDRIKYSAIRNMEKLHTIQIAESQPSEVIEEQAS